MVWAVVFTKQAQKDARKLASAGLKSTAEQLIEVLLNNPCQALSPYVKLQGDLTGAYSRRINIHHRLVYQIIKDKQAVKVIRMWTYYE